MSLHTLVEARRTELHLKGIVDTDYQTDDYKLGLDLGNAGKAMYIVVNRVHGVVEYASSCLPDAMSIMYSTQTALDKLRQVPEVPKDQ